MRLGLVQACVSGNLLERSELVKIRPITEERGKLLTIPSTEEVVAAVTKDYGLTVEDFLAAGSRHPAEVEARGVAFWILLRLTLKSRVEIAGALGLTRSVVRDSVARFERQVAQNPGLLERATRIGAGLAGSEAVP